MGCAPLVHCEFGDVVSFSSASSSDALSSSSNSASSSLSEAESNSRDRCIALCRRARSCAL
jgi:hypothetical protein